MKIEITLSVKVSVDEDKANINDVVRAIGKVFQETGVHLLKQVLKQWEERIVAAALWGRGYCGASSQGEPRQGLSGEERLDTKGGDRTRAGFHHPVGRDETEAEGDEMSGLWRPASSASGLVRSRTLPAGGDGDKTEGHRPGSGPLLPARVQATGELGGC